MKEVAIFGGAFDPPTLAHEAIIQACLERDDIDEVWVLPSGKRTDKPAMLGNDIRLCMLEAMVRGSFADESRLRICDVELQLPQPTNTHRTVTELRRLHPKNHYWFVFGADSYQTMHTWIAGDELKRSLGMLLVRRGPDELPKVPNVRELVVGSDCLEISSTAVRQALQRGVAVDRYLSAAVAAFLHDYHCYGAYNDK